MKLNNPTARGGLASFFHNEMQLEIAQWKLLKTKEFVFFAQHCFEDIEIHVAPKEIILMQVKLSHKAPSMQNIKTEIKNYLKKRDYLEFYLNNDTDIKKWIWAINFTPKGMLNEKKFIKKMFDELIDESEDIYDRDNNLIRNKSVVIKFLKLFKRKFSFEIKDFFVEPELIEEIILKNAKFSTRLDDFKSNGLYKGKIITSSRIFILTQSKILKENIEFFEEITQFEDFRNEFNGWSSFDFEEHILTHKHPNNVDTNLFAKLRMNFPPIKLTILIKNINNYWAQKELESAGFDINEIRKLKGELYANK